MKKYFIIFAIVFCFFLVLTAHAAIIVDRNTTSSCAACSSLSFSHVVTSTGTNLFLMLGFAAWDQAGDVTPVASSVTYGGVPMALATSIVNTGDALNKEFQYYLVNPQTGSNTVAITMQGANASIIAGATSFTGVNQSTPLRASAASSSASTVDQKVTVPSAVSDLVIDTICSGSSITAPSSTQTQQFLSNVDGSTGCNNIGGSTKAGAASVTMEWTLQGDETDILASSIEPAISSPTNVNGYAWGNRTGWINFGTSLGGLEVYSTTVQGYAWSQNFGWINMAPTGHAGISLVQSASSTLADVGAYTIQMSTTTTAGDLIVVWVSGGDTDTFTVTDNAGNAYTAATAGVVNASCNQQQQIFYAKNINNTSTPITITVADTQASGEQAFAYEYRGVATSNPLDVTSTQATTDTANASTSAVTLSGSSDLAFSGYVGCSGNAGTAGANYALRIVNNSAQFATEDWFTASGTIQGLWVNPTDYTTVLLAAFKASTSTVGVQNDGNGNLSGYAWAQDLGYINFKGVTIDSNGVFHGIASGTVAGSIQFDSSGGCTYCDVSTTWTPNVGASLTVSSVEVNGTNPSTITLTPDTTTNVNVEATVTDSTCSLITGGTTTILFYRSGVTSSSCLSGSGNGVSSNLNCYTATAFTASSTCSTGTINTTTTFPIQYFAQSTDGSSNYQGQNWIATVIFNDSSHATSSADSTYATSSNVMSTLAAINITTSSIGYGTVAPSSTTGAVNQTTVVQNAGNSSTTLQLSGNALVNGTKIIATSSQHYATSTFTFGGSEQVLSGNATAVSGFFLAAPTSTTNVQSTIYWGLGVPNGSATGTYAGTNVFTAALPTSGYSYYRTITVTSTASIASGTLTNFPMLVASTLSSWEPVSDGGHVQNLCTAPDGGQEPCDLVFATSPSNCGTSNLNFETESYVSSTGALVDWVNVPTMSTGTVIYACYDDAGVTTDQSHPSSTWSNGYVAVWHLAGGYSTSTGFYKDSTQYGNNATLVDPSGNSVSTSSLIGTSIYFSPSGNAYVAVSTTASLDLNNISFTIQAWTKFTAPNILAGIVGGSVNGDVVPFLDLREDNNTEGIYVINQSGTFAGVQKSATVAPGNWYFADATENASSDILSVDLNSSGNPATTTETPNDEFGPWEIGVSGNPHGFDNMEDGLIDEVEISNVVRSSQWINTAYNNQSSPSTFYTLGGEL